MRKLLIVLEDYNELLYLEAFFKKLGFDVEGVQSAPKAEQSLIAFAPHIVIVSGRNRQFNGIELCRKMEQATARSLVKPKFILMTTSSKVTGFRDDRGLISAMLPSPVTPKILIETVCDVAELDPEPLFKKLELFAGGADKDGKQPLHSIVDVMVFKGDSSPTPREEKYAEILKGLPPIQVKSLSMREIADRATREGTDDMEVSPDSPDDRDLLDAKRAFVKHMFTKKTS